MFDFGQLLGSLGPAFQAFGTGMQVTAAYGSAKNQQAALNAQAQVAQNNATLSDWQAEDAVARGENAANLARLRGAGVKGAQRAAMAANNIDLSVGSAQNILNDTDFITAVDASTLVNNAAREAWGYKVQAQQFRQTSASQRTAAGQISPWLAAGSTLLDSATRVAKSWYPTNSTAKTSAGGGSDALSGLLALNDNYGTGRP